MGQAPSGKSYNDQYQGIPLIAGAGDLGEFTPKPSRYTTEPSKVSSSGDIILCIRATIGDRNWSNQPYCLGRGVAGLRAIDSKLDSRYLWFWLETSKKILLKQARGSTFKQIDKKALQNLSIPLPPLEEQKRIAAILDKADAIRRKRKEAIALTDELLRSTFLDMFGDPVTNPKGWEKVKFQEIFESIRYGTSTPPSFQDEGIPFIRATNIKNGTISTNDLRFISSAEAKKIQKCKLKYGDIVIVRSGVNSGDSALITKEYKNAYAGYDMIIDINPPLSIFYNYLINDNSVKEMIKPLTKRECQPHLNADQVRNLEFILPPESLINNFNEVFDTYNSEKQKLNKSLVCLDNLFNSLLQKAFRGVL